MAHRFTIAESIVVAQQYRAVIANNDQSEEGRKIIETWQDMASRHGNSAPLLYALSAYPEANIFRYFNTSVSVRKIETAIEKGIDFSAVTADDEETEEDETLAAKRRGPKPKAAGVQRQLLQEDRETDVMGLLNLEV